MRLCVKRAAPSFFLVRVAENPDPATHSRRFRYVSPLYTVAEANMRIEQRNGYSSLRQNSG